MKICGSFASIAERFYIIGKQFPMLEQRVALQLFARRCAQALACIIRLRIVRIHSGAFLYHRKAISYDIKKVCTIA
jgi:hypothetical protein